ncbi:MAG: MFS transporter [Steroidobacteraceae bacterium]
MLAYVVGYVDRQVLSLLAVPIKASLGLSETELGALQGFAFGTFYTLLGLPIARLVDRSNRRNLLALGITVWSLMTATCGLARNFLELLLARIGVGVGEATLAPAAVSLIGDYFAPRQRAVALGLYISAGSMGGGLAYLLGAAAIAWTETWDRGGIVLLETMQPWQVVFVLVGLPGLLVATLLLAVGEPRRRECAPGAADDRLFSAPFRALLRRRGALFGWHFVGFGLYSVATYAVLSWVAVHFIRAFSWSPERFGFAFGWVFLFGGAAGAVTGGWVAAWMRKRGWRAPDLTTAALGATLSIPAMVGGCLALSPTLALAFLAVGMFLIAFPSAPSVAAFQEVTPNEFRGRVSALYYLNINLVGLGFGALAVGVVSDSLLGTDQRVGLSMAIVMLLFAPPGVACLWRARQVRLRDAD